MGCKCNLINYFSKSTNLNSKIISDCLPAKFGQIRFCLRNPALRHSIPHTDCPHFHHRHFHCCSACNSWLHVCGRYYRWLAVEFSVLPVVAAPDVPVDQQKALRSEHSPSQQQGCGVRKPCFHYSHAAHARCWN